MSEVSGLKRDVCSRKVGQENKDTVPIYGIISRLRSSSRWKINIKVCFGKRFIRRELRSIGIQLSDYSNEPWAIINQNFQFLNCCELLREINVSGLWLSFRWSVDWLFCKLAGRFVGWLVGWMLVDQSFSGVVIQTKARTLNFVTFIHCLL